MRRAVRPARLSRARLAVLDVLASQPEPCSVSSVAAALDQHTNTVREHLEGLVEAGLATSETPRPTAGAARPGSTPRSPSRRRRRAPPSTRAWPRRSRPRSPGRAPTPWATRSPRAAPGARSSSGPRACGEPGAPGRHVGVPDGVGRPGTAGDGSGTARGEPGGAPTTPRAARATRSSTCWTVWGSPPGRRRRGLGRADPLPLLEAAYRNPEVVCAVHLGLAQGPSSGSALLGRDVAAALRRAGRVPPAPATPGGTR
ncbi:helix-turn-helix domain-containing protein [Oerskovia sp. M15]